MELREGLGMLGFSMLEAESAGMANATLAEVVRSADTRLWEGFPVMMANSLDRRWFNYEELGKLLGTRELLATLDSLITLSLALYEVLAVRSSEIDSFRERFGADTSQDYFPMVERLRTGEDILLSGQTISSERVGRTFARYFTDKETRLADLLSEQTQHDLQYALSQIFSIRQKELVLKKLKGEPLTKTEREYYSRTVRKKILALANPELHRLSQKLLA